MSYREMLHDALHGIVLPLAFWLWHERRILKDVLENGLERRHPVLKYLKLVPVLEKLAKDLEADAASPESQAVAVDVRELITDIAACQAPTA